MKIVIIIIYILISSINTSKASEEETDINFYKLIEQYILDNPEIIIESLEKYSEVRNDFRSKVIKHKKNRRLAIGPNATLYFEDNLIRVGTCHHP